VFVKERLLAWGEFKRFWDTFRCVSYKLRECKGEELEDLRFLRRLRIRPNELVGVSSDILDNEID